MRLHPCHLLLKERTGRELEIDLMKHSWELAAESTGFPVYM